ncbi:MAG: hypothetical protein K0S70_165 [Microbacterium sp.]|jgi:hypothetical protein|nr:hypothetical protein [Microbacterium sp.]
MSDKTRYYRLDDGSPQAGLLCSTAEKPFHQHDEQDFWTEVQVVPLDAIVIRRDELPEVDATRGARVNSVGIGWALDYLTADREEKARSYGLAYLALAEYLREHPPVDEAQVKALTDLIDEDEEWGEDGSAETVARRLIATGRVRVGDA